MFLFFSFDGLSIGLVQFSGNFQALRDSPALMKDENENQTLKFLRMIGRLELEI